MMFRSLNAARACAGAVAMALLWASPAFADYFDNQDTEGPSFGHFDERNALSNAQRLSTMLSVHRKAERVQVFKDAQNAWYATFSYVLRKYINYELSRRPTPVLEAFLRALDVAKATNLVANQLLQLQLATTPKQITAFYATVSNARLATNSAGAHTAWVLQEGDGNHQLQFWVTAIIPGSQTPVLTPAGLADHIVHAVHVDKRIDWIIQPTIRPWVRDAVKYAFNAAAEKLKSQAYLPYGFNPPDEWLNTDKTAVPLPEIKLGPIAVGDTRVVTIDPPSSGAVKIDPVPRELLGDALGFVVTSKNPGGATTEAHLTPEFRGLGSNFSFDTRRMAFLVEPKKKNRSPNIESPMPTWTGPNTAPVLPAPKLLEPPKPPKLPAAPPAPATPSGPKMLYPMGPCGKPGDGGSTNPYTGKCEYGR